MTTSPRRWLLDTSAYSRRGVRVVGDELARRLDAGDELCLSAPVLLELLRAPRGAAVAAALEGLTDAFEVVALTPNTTKLAAEAMVTLAERSPDAHRLPIADLLTAAQASELGFGVLHVDHDFDVLSTSGLQFESEMVCSPDDLPSGTQQSPAARQRELRRVLNRTLSQLSIDDAQRLLGSFVEQAQATLEKSPQNS